MTNKKVGRPIEKLNRKKIGLSLDGITNDILDDLSKNLGKTKSKIVEEALFLYNEHNKNIQKELEIIVKSKDDPYYKLKDMLYSSFKSSD